MTKKVFFIAAAAVTIVVLAVSFIYVYLIPPSEKALTGDEKAALVYDRALYFLDTGDEVNAVKGFTAVAEVFGDSKYTEMALRHLAEVYLRKGDNDNAGYYYSWLLKSFPAAKDAPKIQEELEKISMQKLMTPEDSPGNAEYIVQPGDSLYAIAKKFNTTVAFIKKTNALETDTIRIGQKLNINVPKFSIFVDKSENTLILIKDGEPFKTYSVATGKDNSTPVGVFTIVDKMEKPVWTKPGVGMIMPDSEEYELGERWIPISAQGYGIHGTSDETSIGKQSTAGCVRMRNEDVIELYDIVPRGTEVEIVD